jgi:hypothetical protein
MFKHRYLLSATKGVPDLKAKGKLLLYPHNHPRQQTTCLRALKGWTTRPLIYPNEKPRIAPGLSA